MSSVTSLLPAIPTYLADIKDETGKAEKWAKTDVTAKVDIADLESSADKLDTAKDLLKDYKALKTVLTAFGMEGSISSTALLKQLMTQDPTSSTSLAQKSGNATWLRFAKAMNGYATNPFADSEGLASVVSSYTVAAYEKAQGNMVVGLKQALAFQRTASAITSANSLILNPDALKVVVSQTGLNYAQFATLGYSQQVSLLNRTVTFSDFQDTKKVNQLAEQYLLQAGQDPTNWGAVDATTYTITSLFGANSTPSVLDLFGSSTSTSYSVLNLFA